MTIGHFAGDDFTSASNLLEAVFKFQEENQTENVSDDVTECNGHQAVSLPPSNAGMPAKEDVEPYNVKEVDELKNTTLKHSESELGKLHLYHFV